MPWLINSCGWKLLRVNFKKRTLIAPAGSLLATTLVRPSATGYG